MDVTGVIPLHDAYRQQVYLREKQKTKQKQRDFPSCFQKSVSIAIHYLILSLPKLILF